MSTKPFVEYAINLIYVVAKSYIMDIYCCITVEFYLFKEFTCQLLRKFVVLNARNFVVVAYKSVQLHTPQEMSEIRTIAGYVFDFNRHLVSRIFQFLKLLLYCLILKEDKAPW